jgi:hypothetical protein
MFYKSWNFSLVSILLIHRERRTLLSKIYVICCAIPEETSHKRHIETWFGMWYKTAIFYLYQLLLLLFLNFIFKLVVLTINSQNEAIILCEIWKLNINFLLSEKWRERTIGYNLKFVLMFLFLIYKIKLLFSKVNNNDNKCIILSLVY